MPPFFMCSKPIQLSSGLLVPCGKCGNCLRRKISDYVIRCTVEQRFTRRSYFITLTYAESPLTCLKSDLQNYFKRLRKLGCTFSYFALGDYGDTFGRPHYHVVLFAKEQFPIDRLESCWTGGRNGSSRGFVTIDALSIGRVGYVVSYGFLAKVDWQERFIGGYGPAVIPPFFLMSRRPAIGSLYIERSRSFHVGNDAWFYPDGKYNKGLPRYYRDKIFYCPALRKCHSVLFNLDSEERLQALLSREFFRCSDPYSKYVERVTVNSDLYLAKLRIKKQSKNKLL